MYCHDFNMNDYNAVNNSIVLGTKLSKNDEGTIVDTTLFKEEVERLVYLITIRPNLI